MLDRLPEGEFAIAYGGGNADTGKAAPSLLLLFPRGERPDSASLRDALVRTSTLTISLDHAGESADGSQQGDGPWFEVSASGLTFEVRGFGEGTDDARWAQAKADGLALAAATNSETATGNFYAAIVMRVSPHLVDGAMTPPILRGLCNAASQLGAQFSRLTGIGWEPAGTVFTADRFHSMVKQWSKGSALPVDFFIRFREDLDRGLTSMGLAAYIGQELRLEPDVVDDRSTAERLGQRLATQLIPMGALNQPQDFAMPDGRNLRLEPSKNSRFVQAFLR